VAVYINSQLRAVVEAPAVLGEISLLWMLLDRPHPRYRTYRAHTPCKCW
jgi:hypothetical protein